MVEFVQLFGYKTKGVYNFPHATIENKLRKSYHNLGDSLVHDCSKVRGLSCHLILMGLGEPSDHLTVLVLSLVQVSKQRIHALLQGVHLHNDHV